MSDPIKLIRSNQPVWCGGCHTMKTAADFYKNTTSRGFWTLQYKCKACQHKERTEWRDKDPKERARLNEARYWNSIKQKHKLTKAAFIAILEEQGWECPICNKELQIIGRKSHIDHCHETGKIRGILCQLCNQGLGQFKDSPKLLRKAIAYLKNAREDGPL